MADLASKIKGLAEVKKINDTQLAKLVPMGKSYLSKIINGKVTNPTIKIIKGLANALDINVNYLINDSFNETRSWQKIAADESLELFLINGNLSQQEISKLRRITFTQDTPLTLKEWEKLWNNINIFRQSNKTSKTHKYASKQRNTINLNDKNNSV